VVRGTDIGNHCSNICLIKKVVQTLANRLNNAQGEIAIVFALDLLDVKINYKLCCRCQGYLSHLGGPSIFVVDLSDQSNEAQFTRVNF
jgi:hypothetical protein